MCSFVKLKFHMDPFDICGDNQKKVQGAKKTYSCKGELLEPNKKFVQG